MQVLQVERELWLFVIHVDIQVVVIGAILGLSGLLFLVVILSPGDVVRLHFIIIISSLVLSYWPLPA